MVNEKFDKIEEVSGKRLLGWLEFAYDIEVNGKALTPPPFKYDAIRKELEKRLAPKERFVSNPKEFSHRPFAKKK